MTGRNRWLCLGLALAWPTAAACNMVTGADHIRLDDDDSSSGSLSSGAGATGQGAGAGPTVGAGGVTNGTGGAVASSGAGASPTNCEYPQGPYGVAQGQTIPPNLSWQGYPPGATQPVTVTSQDFFDCDGTRGIDAVLFDTAQFG